MAFRLDAMLFSAKHFAKIAILKDYIHKNIHVHAHGPPHAYGPPAIYLTRSCKSVTFLQSSNNNVYIILFFLQRF